MAKQIENLNSERPAARKLAKRKIITQNAVQDKEFEALQAQYSKLEKSVLDEEKKVTQLVALAEEYQINDVTMTN